MTLSGRYPLPFNMIFICRQVARKDANNLLARKKDLENLLL